MRRARMEANKEGIRQFGRELRQSRRELAALGFGLRVLVYGALAILIGIALGACGEAGTGAVAGPKPDCGRVITVPFQDGTGTLTITVFYPDSLKQNCGPASGDD